MPGDTVDNISPVVPGVFLSNVFAATSLETTRKFGITRVLVAGTELGSVAERHREVFGASNVLWIDVLDRPEAKILPHFKAAVEFLDAGVKSESGGTLVHCMAGVSRSVCLVVAYLMKKKKWSARKAVLFVQKKRPVAGPNLGFMRQLKVYERELIKQRAVEGDEEQSVASSNSCLRFFAHFCPPKVRDTEEEVIVRRSERSEKPDSQRERKREGEGEGEGEEEPPWSPSTNGNSSSPAQRGRN
uniref:protein-tyrosine-phosphatase n=1 Tax=Chromera velia CCMP2878 TaxID=1169474 RepID=A0A0G4IBJ1_9ALVE|eukprot:Cvel_2206.t1-p1 / transcript=Cvel_2206.t1 / gene=Cvel_2206 / organism=Chromera_velia_CCMP2878 / gene_product=Dual specificity protein phosphatase 1, putative / transcript_product=Dual specificity protein phosphatase 1, putative / location=Cvel_scaffold85:52382-53110(-) / protein_length=243 / sequence_SO=supercontig / SO=protein_coding / is_pseudo=false